MTAFSEVLELADKLTVDQLESLVETLRRRVAERNRERILRDVLEARDEYANRRTRPFESERTDGSSF